MAHMDTDEVSTLKGGSVQTVAIIAHNTSRDHGNRAVAKGDNSSRFGAGMSASAQVADEHTESAADYVSMTNDGISIDDEGKRHIV